MRRRPPRSTQSRSAAASDVYKRQAITTEPTYADVATGLTISRYGVTAIALDNAEEVASGIYFARVIIL